MKLTNSLMSYSQNILLPEKQKVDLKSCKAEKQCLRGPRKVHLDAIQRNLKTARI